MGFSLHSLASATITCLTPIEDFICRYDVIEYETSHKTGQIGWFLKKFINFFSPLEVSGGKASGDCFSGQIMFMYKWNIWLGFF